MMTYYNNKSNWKIYLAISGILVLLISVFYTNYLAQKLSEGEKNKVILWAKAYESISKNTTDSETDMTVQLEIVGSNKDIPTILVQSSEKTEKIIEGANFGKELDGDTTYLRKELNSIRKAGTAPIVIETEFYTQLLYFKHSRALGLLTYFPLIQFFLIFAFVLLGYIGFSGVKSAEQNQVWVGMAKETAHQLGTPISAIVAWIEIMKNQEGTQEGQNEILLELTKDVDRLNLIADRFSKIGSAPELLKTNLYEKLQDSMQYMQKRAPRKIEFRLSPATNLGINVALNGHLFDWVIENLIRNSLDAMGNTGTISVEYGIKEGKVYIDVNDTGKGIAQGQQKRVFSPGFTTKKRGWGLGLSLAKRIIENYHSGKIFVKKSILGLGTTFTIILPLND